MPRWMKAGVVLMGLVVAAALLYPVFMEERGSRIDTDIANIHELAFVVDMYIADYDRAPDPRVWSDQLMEYVRDPEVFRSPRARNLRAGYALNAGAQAADRRVVESPEAARLVTIFESDRGWNAHGGRELLPVKPRYEGGDNYGFLDGHVQWVKRGDTSVPMQWQVAAPGRPRGPAAGR